MADKDIHFTVLIQVGNGQCIRDYLRISERDTFGKSLIFLPEINIHSFVLVDRYDVKDAIPIKICHCCHSNGRIRRPKGNTTGIRESGIRTTKVYITLTAIPIRYDKVDESIFIYVCRENCRGRIGSKWDAISAEPPVSMV